ncbi:parallel beta helix pectate lyase-like protein [Microbacterium telephonicum]|uniref:Parallel beta helix pectate lyase-like protein n=1 Tax=Microbacterium telephonicum TaxID=1714841 RepID=A0A498C5X2_9MICO|nr:parallel beta helix pectate lyase-like protein [Microbacterium telephonicum]
MNRSLVTTAAIVGLLAALVLPTGAWAEDLEGTTYDETEVVSGDAYPGDPDVEAMLVSSEERRLIDVRAIANAAGWTNINQGRPYRLVTGNTYTLVLIPRESPYTLADLLQYAPSTFVRQPDGSYLLSENIVVEQGATLKLEDEEGLVLHLASTPDAFVSIVTIGGSIELAGTAEKPIEVAAWDPVSQTADTDTTDGRAYLRVTGGVARFSHVDFHDLGFWSGATGGVALTGNAAPDTLKEYDDLNRVGRDTEDAGTTTVYGTEIFPADGAELLTTEPDLGAYSYVAADIDDISVRDNAFGLFITSAQGVDIRNSSFEHNLVDGLVLHRDVTNTVVHNTTVSHNAVDGVAVTRAATGVVLSRLTVEQNGRNGITIEGGPLADGPSAMGTSVGDYGNNEVEDSMVSGNGRYGIEILGGEHLTVDANTVDGHDMGIVVADAVSDVTITDNLVQHSSEHAIALRGGVTGATVQGNDIDGGEVGIYLRDASGSVDRNTIIGVSNHAVTLIAATGATQITNNDVSGRGPSAIDIARAGSIDPTTRANDVDAWVSTKPLDVILRSIFQPLTVLWLILGALVVFSAISGVRARRKNAGIRHPYASHTPLSQLTSGIADPTAFGRPPAHEGNSR